ncbi:MAG: cytochrome C biogenesis protein CcdA [Thermoleophilia bacterium]|nr:cytochrome C biogenesis protein CcdA [Thermoleophilia bacterium]
MRRLVAAVVLAAALAASAPAVAGPSPSDLEAELVCPTCRTTLDQSDAPVARRMKAIIRERLAAGASEEEIKAELVAQFGPGVLAEPPRSGLDLVAWALPLALVGAGAVALGVVAVAWRRRAVPEGTRAVIDPELERRVDDELARYDA